MNYKKILKIILVFFILCTSLIITSCKEKDNKIYTITFDLNDGTLVNGNTEIKVSDLNKILYPEVTKTGFNLIRWEEKTKIDTKITYQAIWEVAKYLVTYLNGNGSILYEEEVLYNENANCSLIPVKKSTDTEEYKFISWDQNTTNITNDLIVKPLWETTERKYKVVFLNGDDTHLYEDEVTYNGNVNCPYTPVKEDLEFNYIFAGWDQQTDQITSSLIIKPNWKKTYKKYTVTFYNSDNSILDTKEVNYNKSVTSDKNPILPVARSGYINIFTGWDQELTNVKTNLNVKPLYKEVKLHHVKFINYNGDVLSEMDVIDNDNAIYNGDVPTRTEDNEYIYHFLEWDKSLNNITSDTIIRARYTMSVKQYTYTFIDEDDKVILTGKTGYNKPIPAPDKMPNKIIDELLYEFIGWDPEYKENDKIKEDITYKAVYISKEIEFNLTIWDDLDKEPIVNTYFSIKTIKEPVITKEGYYIGGFYTTPSFIDSTKVEFPLEINKDITLYVKWIENKQINYCLGDFVYQSKQDLFNSLWTDFYFFIINQGNQLDGINSKTDFLTLASDFNAGRGQMRAIGDLAGNYFLERDLGGTIENQTSKKFVGYCYQNNYYVDFLLFQIDFFAWWRQDEGYTTPYNNGSDFFAESWAPVVDMGKFFYYNESTSYVQSERVRDCFINIPGVLKTTLPNDLTTNITLVNPERTGYTFIGWYDNPEFTGTSYTYINANQFSELTLYAKWIKN